MIFIFLLRSTFIFEMCEFNLKSHLNNAVDCKVGPWRCNNQMKGVVMSLLVCDRGRYDKESAKGSN